MQDAMDIRLMQAIKTDLDFCESEISALAREALSPATTAGRRAEALIDRAKMQTRSVSLSRQLQRLRLEQDALEQEASELKELRERARSRRRLYDRFLVQDFSRAS